MRMSKEEVLTVVDYLLKEGGPDGLDMRELLKYLMDSGGERVTQAELAEAIGLRRATISDYLTGKSSISVDAYERAVRWLVNNV